MKENIETEVQIEQNAKLNETFVASVNNSYFRDHMPLRLRISMWRRHWSTKAKFKF